jgi:hypothetical protein
MKFEKRYIEFNEAQRASSGGPTTLNFHTSLSKKIHERPPAAGGRQRRRLRPPFATLPLATLPPATLLFATLRACGGLRPPCGGGLRRRFHRDPLKTVTRYCYALA